MTAKQVGKQFIAGLSNLQLSEVQIVGVVALATDLLSDAIPLEPIEQVEQRATEVMEGRS